jgi:hypothetical protein
MGINLKRLWKTPVGPGYAVFTWKFITMSVPRTFILYLCIIVPMRNKLFKAKIILYLCTLLTRPGRRGRVLAIRPPPPSPPRTHSPLSVLTLFTALFLIFPPAVLPIPAMAGCFPRGVPQGDGPYFLPPHHDYADPLLDQPNDWGSEPEEDDGFVEVLEVDEYP